jgi:hypothetical protein
LLKGAATLPVGRIVAQLIHSLLDLGGLFGPLSECGLGPLFFASQRFLELGLPGLHQDR